jgi:subtilisin family serine protease
LRRSRKGATSRRLVRRSSFFALVAAAAAALVAVAVSSAASNGAVAKAPFAKVDPSLLASTSGFKPLSLDTTPVQVMVQLDTPPVAVQIADAKKHGKQLSNAQQDSIRQQIKSQQDGLKGAFGQHGAKVIAQLQSAYNGVQVQVPRNQITDLASIPGVVGVHAIRTFTVGPRNVNGIPFVHAPQAWSFNETGRGVKIADIDTGIDYTHADFGGPGTTAAFAAAKATSTAAPDPNLVGPNAPKVKGGYDFVGDAYDATDPTSVPQPDPNPLDCNGHGTHTAGTVAGDGVLADGSTYTGPYNSTTVSSHDWTVGPGVAPQAEIYAYRVFGCEGSSNVVDLAIDRAVADHVDVITMSLGSDLGGVDDPTTVAAENAAAAGITVVAAAGNAGPSGYIVSSPSTGPHVLSVAALDGSKPSYPGARLALSTGKSVDTIDANGAALPSGTFPVKVLKNADGTIALGCDPAQYAGSTGAIVVTKRGTCARVARAIFGQKAGAAAVVMVNSDGTLPPFEGPITSNPDTGEPYNVTIPFLGAAGTAANTAALLAADGGTTTLSSISIPNTGYEHVASFSSAGPANPDSSAKPEVIAPGVSVASAGVGTGNGFLVESGTSMATPMTAGIAALVKQAHPSWTGTQIKAAIENTADPSLNIGYNVRRAGAGAVQADNAVATTVLATTDDGLDSLAFGYVPGTGSWTSTKSFTLTNTGANAVTYALAASPDSGGLGGGGISVSPSSVTVPAGGTQTVSVTLSYSAAAFAALPSMSSTGPGQVVSFAGVVTATPNGGGQGLRVPFMVVPRGLSNLATDVRRVGNNATATVTNSGIHAGGADVYAWGLHDAEENDAPMDIRDVGIQSFPGDVAGADPSDRFNVIAINTYGRFTNPSVNEFDVGIDTNGDGSADYVVVGADLGAVTTGTFNGQYVSFIFDAKNNLVDAWFATAPMNGSVVELPFLSSDINTNSTSGAFAYTVTGFSIVPGSLVDTTGTASYDPYKPAVDSGQFLGLAPGESGTIQLTRDPVQLGHQKPLGWLAVNLDDANGAAQADEIPLNNGRP